MIDKNILSALQTDTEAFIEKLEQSYPSVQYVNKLITHSWGQKVTRFMIWTAT